MQPRARGWLGSAAVLLGVLGAACAKTQTGPDPAPAGGLNGSGATAAAESAPAQPSGAGQLVTAPPAGSTARNGPPDVSPDSAPPALDALELPPGFHIELYATDIPNARSLALGPKGVVFVSNRTSDKVYAVVDSNGDHKADRTLVVAKGLDTPNGIAYRDGALYIAEIGRLLRLDGIDKRLENPPEPKVLTDAFPKEKHHGWRYIRFGPDGWLYMPVGAPCNVCERPEQVFSTLARMKPDGTGFEIYASGVRNSLGFDWHPQTKELWFTENGRDELGDDIPSDELNRAPKAGLDFGFPHCHEGKYIDPEFGKGTSCDKFEPPVQALGPHVAALGMRFYTGKMFPQSYENAAIVALHGSWNRSHKSGYSVMVVRLEGNRAVSYEPLVKGWLDESKDSVSGRPVDVEVLDDGSLLVSDDYRGVLYRVTYKAS
jgi:glucose/arabinose dehydrogenase